ncbi:cation diffusion facilitator family transporter [Clostridium chauvoei]|uniref:Cation diffusion facilitator family transporter n=2 Tax=Clostridium chauvoei TaxID=46867 RepID=A0ABD4RHW3_9CLOT|nr:cation diffusion facilitator family transporter [Clostridium chauvoei]ATD55483.1 cation-efflux pump [Clostridium chauvoei]ATD56843.1 cation-efflux pump [Clostridium chauvoei]MBX7280698.1 cation diffusion facilitator family transporter [Clostridium chauvoei]MBX7283181.1 cation diffusion facilitator family transporter [Clostridium chauvoei]MBX7285739.1 cation diffusion facilitator family transporter [Clostridium chauvoei]
MDNRLDIGIKVSKTTIIGNIILSIVKVVVGVFSNSNAMIADGIHSFSDVISTIGVIIGLKLSSKPADKEHPYGHERIESLSSLLLSIMLFIIALGIGISGIKDILNKSFVIPGSLAIFAALFSIITKEWMYFYTIKYANMIDSASLKADAWHHRSDSLSSIGALLGIIGARMGFPLLDPLASLLICIMIIKVSYDIAKQSMSQLIDESAKDDIICEITSKINSIDDIKKIDSIRTRLHSTRIYVDVEISVDASLTVEEGHDIAMKVHNLIEENKKIKHCMVHINPFILTSDC